MVERLSDLREPPKVGEFYLVPVIENFPWHGIVSDWPVLGPRHTDQEFFDFPHQHYHVDARFVSARQTSRVIGWRSKLGYDIDSFVGRAPLIFGERPNFIGPPRPIAQPQLRRRRCRRASVEYHYGDTKQVQALRKHFGQEVAPIRLDDGRLLCPHRKADLTQFPVGVDGIVVCPLHGLRVRCSASKVAA